MSLTQTCTALHDIVSALFQDGTPYPSASSSLLRIFAIFGVKANVYNHGRKQNGDGRESEQNVGDHTRSIDSG